MKKQIPDFLEKNGIANVIVYPATSSRWMPFGVTRTCTLDYYELSLKTAEFEVSWVSLTIPILLHLADAV